MLRSLALHETQHPVFADTINLGPEQVTELQQAYPRLTIDTDMMPENARSKAFMASRKAFVMQRVMDRGVHLRRDTL